ncbi:MAG: response regulator [Oscillospiraceae bacterium]|nr:response regulator [Oscillospiraceae bacterium]
MHKEKKGKLSKKFSNISILMITFVLLANTVICFIMIYNLTTNASEDYVRFYATETADVLSSHLSNEIFLVSQAATSPDIIAWFADENNLEKREAAFNRMMFFADVVKMQGLYFGIYDSLHEFAIERGTSFDDFVHYHTMSPDGEYDQWFFDAINSGFDYILKLDTVKSSEDISIWIDHLVKDNGRIVGVFSTAIPFDAVFEDLFGHYNKDDVWGIIIDHEGIVQVDSSIPDASYILSSLEVYDVSEMTHIFELKYDPAFIAALNKYLDNPRVFYGQRVEPEIIRVSTWGEYQYRAITPIPNTNWLAVISYSSGTLFSIMDTIPPLIAMIFIFIIYVVFSSLLINRLVFNPLQRLTEGLAEQDVDSLYGADRDDEIGDLAKETIASWNTISKDLDEQKTMMNEIKRRDKLLNSMNLAASILLGSETVDFEDDLMRCMSIMGRAVDAHRVYIYTNNVKNGELCFSQLYQWVEDFLPILDSSQTNDVSYNDNLSDWEEVLRKGECVNGIAKDMSRSTYKFLKSADVVSFFAAPIFVDNKFWGFVGFDDCKVERIFTENEAVIMRSGCLLIGNAFLRHDMTLNLESNISQLKALQEELEDALQRANEANHSKSTFLAHMSHEIRTPMNSIVGFSELAIDEENTPPKVADYLSKILQNSEWLLQIINDVLDISKIESGKMDLEKIPFDLAEMFNACRMAIIHIATEKGLVMHFYAEPSVGKKLYGDPTRLRQVLVNLLSNAVKFTNTGSIKMQAIIKETTDDSVTMYFEVRDSGIGIDSEKLKNIFDPFTQAETGTTRKYGGSGLGLAISQNIIEAMGGTLCVDSMPGVGSKFSFTLTFDAVDINKEIKSPENIAYKTLKKPTFVGEILLCEDNMMNQEVICEHLSKVGLKTDVAANGKVGVDLVRKRAENKEKQYDLVFMDIHMPVMDGLEATPVIHKIAPDLPIVALTANIMQGAAEQYKEIGMSDCLGKPFTSQELWRCLMKYFTPKIEK